MKPIYSMTGFASRSFELNQTEYRFEVKSLNHRFLELKLRLPRSLQSLEQVLKKRAEERLSRGAVEFFFERKKVSAHSDLKLNFDKAKEAHLALMRLKSELGMSAEIQYRDILSFPEVFSREDEAEELILDEAFYLSFYQEFDQLIKDLMIMRQREGERLRAVLLEQVKALEEVLERFKAAREEIRSKLQEKVTKKVKEHFEMTGAAYPIEEWTVKSFLETRISQEVAYLQDRSDVEEEITRFKGHLLELKTVLTEGGKVGKKLDFLYQELNREVNTLGNKSQDLGVSKDVIEVKTRLEQMREQTLNLE